MSQFQTAEAISATEQDRLRIVAARYEQCHPDDSFEDLRIRARFSKEDRRLLEDWLAAVGGERVHPGESR